eukprot:gene6774-10938_t
MNQTEEIVSLKFKGIDGKITEFKTKNSDLLRGLFEVFKKKKGKQNCNYQYYFEGYPLDGDDTVGEVGFENDDIIDALEE